MPHWVIYHPTTAFQDVDEKRALVQSITSLYTMPSFYVVVNFIKVEPADHWIGGVMAHERSNKPFIRIDIDHIHVRQPNEDSAYLGLVTKWNATLKPHLLDKGYDYEYHIDETERRLWSINGQAPPPWKSEDEELWKQAGKPLTQEEMTAMREKL